MHSHQDDGLLIVKKSSSSFSSDRLSFTALKSSSLAPSDLQWKKGQQTKSKLTCTVANVHWVLHEIALLLTHVVYAVDVCSVWRNCCDIKQLTRHVRMNHADLVTGQKGFLHGIVGVHLLFGQVGSHFVKLALCLLLLLRHRLPGVGAQEVDGKRCDEHQVEANLSDDRNKINV